MIRLALAFLIALSAPALAQRPPADTPEGVAAAMTTLAAKPVATKNDLFVFTAIVLEQGRMNSAGRAAVECLLEGNARTAQLAPGVTAPCAALPEKLKAVLGLVAGKLDLEALWAKNQQGFNQIVDVSRLSPAIRSQIQNYVGNKLLAQWKASNISNKHDPFMQLLRNLYNVLQTADTPDDARHGRQFLFDTVLVLDTNLGGTVPDEFYSWIKPETR